MVVWHMCTKAHFLMPKSVHSRAPRGVINTLTMHTERVIARAHPYLAMLRSTCVGLSGSCIWLIGMLALDIDEYPDVVPGGMLHGLVCSWPMPETRNGSCWMPRQHQSKEFGMACSQIKALLSLLRQNLDMPEGY